MKCSNFISPYCFDGYCPRALYFEYGSDYGDLISCDECYHLLGDCDDCAGCVCPLDYLLAEALPAHDYFNDVRFMGFFDVKDISDR